MALLSIEELDRDAASEQAKQFILAERQCRMTLAADWPRPVALEWHPGKVGQRTMLWLHPGKSIVQPIGKVQCWFGPFPVYFQIRVETDEKKKQRLRDTWKTERERYLNRYDYPRGTGRGVKPDMTPSGPHRSPDVTVTILEADGTESEPIRLYELYRLGEFDPLKDTFIQKESAEQVEARYKAEGAAMNERYEREAQEFRMQVAELKGLIGAKVASDGLSMPKEVKMNAQGKPYDAQSGRILSPQQFEQWKKDNADG